MARGGVGSSGGDDVVIGATVDVDVQAFINKTRQASKIFADEFATRLFHVTQQGEQGFDNIADAATRAGKRAGKSLGDMSDYAMAADDHIHQLYKRLDQMDRAATQLNTTEISNMLGGKASIASLNQSLQDSLHHIRAVNAAIANGATDADTMGLRDVANQMNKQSRQILDMIRQALKAEEQVQRSASAVKAKQLERDTALEKAQIDQRRAIKVAELQRQTVAEKQAGLERVAEIRRAGSLALAREKSNADTRAQIARTLSKSVIAAEQAAGKAIGTSLRTLGTVGNAMLQRWTSTQRSITRTENVEISKRKSIFRSWLRSNETSLHQSVTRQERIIRSFQQRTSTGVAGAVSGRGIGMGIGGALAGFSLFQNISAGMEESSNVVEQSNKIRVVLGKTSQAVIDFTEGSAEKFGLTRGAALEAAGAFSALMKGAGVAKKDAGLFGATLTQLASDMASFNNTSVADAITALRSGLSGETEPLRRFNVFLNDAKLKAKALEMGLYSGKGPLDQYAKSMATMAVIMESTADQQGDFARTSDDYANKSRIAAAKWTEMWAAVATPLKKVKLLVLNEAVPAMDSLTRLVSGENLTAGLEMVRTGLIGVAGGLGAVLLAKGAVEVIQLLGVATKAALTPFGAVLLVAGALGGAYAILSRNSDGFRDSMSKVGKILRELVAPVLDALGGGVDKVKGAIGGAASSLDAFGDLIGEKLVTAATWLSDTVTDTVIPAVKGFSTWARETGVGAVKALADLISGGLNVALRGIGTAASAAGRVLGPILEPAGAAVKNIADALGAVTDGSLSLGKGLGAALTAAWGGVSGVAGNIWSALEPLRNSVTGWFERIFTKANFEKVAKAILGGLETVGYIVGRVVTDKRLWISAAALVAVGATLAASLVKGLARGILDGLPELGGVILDGLGLGLKAAIENPGVVAKLIAGLFLGAAVYGYVRQAGTQIASTFTNAMTEGVGKTTIGGARGATQFVGALFGGVDSALNGQIRGLERASKAYRAEFQKINRDIAALGGTPMRMQSSRVNEAAVASAQAKFDALRTDMGSAATQALLLRARFGAVAASVADVGKAIGGLVMQPSGGGIRALGLEMRTLGSSVRSALSDTWRDAKAQGYSGGQIIGGAMLTGLSSALSGYAGGSSGSTMGVVGGLVGVLGAALAATAINPVLGAVVGGVGLLTTAIGASGAAAKKAAGEVGEWRDALRSAADAAEWAAAASKQLASELENEGEATVTYFNSLVERSGITIDKLAKALASGKDQANAALADLFAPVMSDSRLSAEMAKWGDTWEEIFAKITDGKRSAGTATFAFDMEEMALDAGWAKDEATALMQTLDFLDDELGEIGEAERMQGLIDSIIGARNEVDTTSTAVEELGTALTGSFRTAAEDADAARAAFDLAAGSVRAFLNPDGGTLAQQVRDAVLAVSSASTQDFQGMSVPVADATRGNIIAGFANEMNQAIDAAVTDGITSAADIDAWVLEPLRQQIEQTVTDPALRQGMLDLLAINPGDLQLKIDLQGVAGDAADRKQEVADFFAENPALAEIDAELSPQAKEMLTKIAKLSPEVLAALNAEDSPAARARLAEQFVNIAAMAASGVKSVELPAGAISYDDATSAAWNAGLAIADGIAGGVKNREWTAIKAAQELAAKTSAIVMATLKIQSPSKVMMGHGEMISAGLAEGISRSARLVTRAAEEVVKPLLNGRKRGEIFADIFGVSGSERMGDALSAYKADLADILSRWESVRDAISDARKAQSEGETLNARQRDILGESALSLSINDASGRENRDSIRAALEAAAGITATQVANGTATGAALKALRQRINDVVATFSSLGFSVKGLRRVVDAMGFGPDDMKRYRARLAKERRELEEEQAENRRARRARQSASQAQERRSFIGGPLGNLVGPGFANVISSAFATAASEADASISSISGGVVDSVIESLRTGGTTRGRNRAAMDEITSSLFGRIVGPGSELAGGARVMDARAAFTLAMQEALSDSDSVVSQLKEIREKRARGERLTAAERDMLNENAFSLDLRDVTGATNAQSITSLAAAAAAIAQQQLANGASADVVRRQFGERLANIVESLSALGFNSGDVKAFLDSLGYSAEALNQFTDGVTDATEATSGGGSGGGSTPPPAQGPTEVKIEMSPVMYLPYGDPEAIALAMANRAAMMVL